MTVQNYHPHVTLEDFTNDPEMDCNFTIAGDLRELFDEETNYPCSDAVMAALSDNMRPLVTADPETAWCYFITDDKQVALALVDIVNNWSK
tara:strand:- start:1487 stop:1759 length:273 start_codon:yes stop_codon:yes gene_type:complete